MKPVYKYITLIREIGIKRDLGQERIRKTSIVHI